MTFFGSSRDAFNEFRGVWTQIGQNTVLATWIWNPRKVNCTATDENSVGPIKPPKHDQATSGFEKSLGHGYALTIMAGQPTRPKTEILGRS